MSKILFDNGDVRDIGGDDDHDDDSDSDDADDNHIVTMFDQVIKPECVF